MNSKLFIIPITATLVLSACKSNQPNKDTVANTNQDTIMSDTPKPFEYVSEQFADLRVLRYEIPGFDQLSLQQKELLYYLSEAALSGRDITWDQNYKFNLTVRKTIDAIVIKGMRIPKTIKNL
jgi:dipeptidyl-peptidase-3